MNIKRMRKMRKFNLLILAIITATLASCMKDTEVFDHEAQFEIEKPIIQEYVEKNIPNAIKHELSGIWYEVLEEGEPESYEYRVANAAGQLEAPLVRVRYKGVLLDGTLFDEVTTEEGIQMSLSGVIAAWQYAFFPREIVDTDGAIVEVGGLTIPGLKKGSKIRFVTPSLWAYREYGQGKVPANAPLDFTVEVLDIKAPTAPQI